MARNLYTCSLDDLTFEDVAAFLAITETEALRPPEGPRLDYKSEIPKDLAKHVAALANGQGGLIVLGIEEADGRPIAVPGLPAGKSDLRTQLAQIISMSIDPLPEYDVAVLPVPDRPGISIGIVRVEQSAWPPHFFTKNGSIPLRRQDSVTAATARDLEDLLGVRRESRDRASRSQAPQLPIHRWNPDHGGRLESPTYLKVWLEPMRAQEIALHRPREQELARLVQRVFEEAATFGARGRDYFELVYDPEGFDFHRAWRIGARGGLAFATQIQRAASGPASGGRIPLVDVALDIVRALVVARILLDHLGVGGRCHGGVLLALEEAPVMKTDHSGQLSLSGIAEIPARRPMGWGPTSLDLDSSELANPAAITAAALCTHLREQRHADVDLDDLQAGLEGIVRKKRLVQKV